MSVTLYSLLLPDDRAVDPLWRALLSPEEQQRADRFRRAADRQSFTAAHALARLALGRALGLDPAGLTFTATAKGKPVLCGGPVRLDFSLSHAEGAVAVALAPGEVGVDVETLRRIEIDLALAETALGAAAAARLGPDPSAPAWRAGFLAAWTAREAALKAAGLGLTAPMSGIRIAGATATFGHLRWRLWQSPLPPDHHLAAAWSGTPALSHHPLDPAAVTAWCRGAAPPLR